MFRLTGYPLLFLAMFSIAGGHWAVLQTVAWTGMVIKYSKDTPLVVALEKTFSGKAPCKMCRKIESAKEKESRLPATLTSDMKFDKFFGCAKAEAPRPGRADFSYPPGIDVVAATRSLPPPAPVPIAA
ncbi:MAG: hypothetical protein IAE94_10050 [Chthoniobacterales bacterium]|nr:hypothetical protein [Chthoniobacterales bacterium]